MKMVVVRGKILFQTLGIWIVTSLENSAISAFLYAEKWSHDVVFCFYWYLLKWKGKKLLRISQLLWKRWLILWRAMFPLRDFFQQLPVPMGFLGGSRIQTCPKPGLGQGGAVLMPVMHLTPGDAKTWLGLGKQGQEEGGVQAQQGGVCKAKQGKAREELIKQGSGGMARNGAGGATLLPQHPSSHWGQVMPS